MFKFKIGDKVRLIREEKALVLSNARCKTDDLHKNVIYIIKEVFEKYGHPCIRVDRFSSCYHQDNFVLEKMNWKKKLSE